MFFIWLVMPTNVGKQHLPSRMNRRLCGCPIGSLRYRIAMACQLAIQSGSVDHIVPTRSKKRCSSLFDRHPQLHVPRNSVRAEFQ